MSRFLLLVLPILFVLACARQSNPDIERGSDFKYRRGFPEVSFSATGFLNEKNKPNISISADIVKESLIFKQINGSKKARIAIDIRIIKKNTTDKVVESKHFEVDISPAPSNFLDSRQTYLFKKQLDVPSGSFKVYFTIIDLNSDKDVTRSTETFIPDPNSNQINLTNIRMLGKDLESRTVEWSPITTYDVPAKIDSLMFILQATNNNSREPLIVNSNLVKYDADLSVARPMFFRNYSKGTEEYEGIQYSDDRIIRQSERKLLQEGSVLIEYRFANQNRGNYRFEVKINKDKQFFKARDFSVKSQNYPAVQTARELARPLIYLMDDGKYEDLMAINDPDSMKERIDRFWLKNIGDKNKAKNVIEKYYNRVVEANKQFSNFKEGWKTDPGMVYILFGPPFYINERVNKMTWSYSNNVVNDPRVFRFFQPNVRSEFFPFRHFLLRRNQEHYQVQYQQKQLWLSGLILTRNI